MEEGGRRRALFQLTFAAGLASPLPESKRTTTGSRRRWPLYSISTFETYASDRGLGKEDEGEVGSIHALRDTLLPRESERPNDLV